MKRRRSHKRTLAVCLDPVDIDRLDALARAYEARVPGMELSLSAAVCAAIHVGIGGAWRELCRVDREQLAGTVQVTVVITPADFRRLDTMAEKYKARTLASRPNRSAAARAAVRVGLARIERELGIVAGAGGRRVMTNARGR